MSKQTIDIEQRAVHCIRMLAADDPNTIRAIAMTPYLDLMIQSLQNCKCRSHAICGLDSILSSQARSGTGQPGWRSSRVTGLGSLLGKARELHWRRTSSTIPAHFDFGRRPEHSEQGASQSRAEPAR